LLAISPLGCGIVLGIDDPPALRSEDAGADSTLAVDTKVDEDTAAAIDTTVAEAETSANDGLVAAEAEAEVDAWAGVDGNLLLYRSTDGAALLTRVDEAGAALPPRPLVLPAGFCSLAYVHDLLLGVDDVKMAATVLRLDRKTGSVALLKTRTLGYPFQFALPIRKDRFFLQATDYEHADHTFTARWDDPTSSLDTTDTIWAPWTAGATTWDGHVVFYYRAGATLTITTWVTYDGATDKFTFRDFKGDQQPIGPFWEKLTGFGPTGVFAFRGPSPHGRVIPVVPLGYPDGVDAGPDVSISEAERAHDVVDLPAPIALLAGTKSEQLIFHQGDALVTGHLTTKGSDQAFVSDHRYDSGALAKSWTSMVYLADPSP
jgi:hypothetical protein